MHYVYLLRSAKHPDRTYISLTSDLKARLIKHNEGGSPHTAKYKPWVLMSYFAFSAREKASDFVNDETAGGVSYVLLGLCDVFDQRPVP